MAEQDSWVSLQTKLAHLTKRSAVRSPSTYCLLTIIIKVGSRNHLNPYAVHSLFY
jgi:hypothetical protein